MLGYFRKRVDFFTDARFGAGRAVFVEKTLFNGFVELGEKNTDLRRGVGRFFSDNRLKGFAFDGL